MLLHLNIRNVVIIDEASIALEEGLNVFTGETGAGKSILIDALQLTLGERASVDVVRTGADEAEVSAMFDLEQLPAVREKLKEAGLESDDELLMRRLINKNGRSRAYVNNRPVTVSFLRELGRRMVEISGQHSNHHLMQPRYHLDLLDAFGHLYDMREKITSLYNVARGERKELERLGGDTQSRARREEYLLYQLDELEKAPLDIDESKLEDERRYLLQLEKMLETAQEGEMSIYSGQHAVVETLGRLENRLGEWVELAPDLSSAVEGLAEAQAAIDDVAHSLRGFISNAQVDPQRLEEIEEQLSLLRDLKRKHGVMSVEQLLQRRDEYVQELHDLRGQEARLIELEASCVRRAEELLVAAKALSKRRREAALILAREVEAELASLGMKKARFVVDFQSLTTEEDETLVEPLEEPDIEEGSDEEEDAPETKVAPPLVGSVGMDFVQFLLSSNPGEVPRPLHRTASGGELSRIMLALKQILTEREPVPTCVFDEVDAGIGGFTATIIGEKIRKIGYRRQVFCITHLPQIACFSDYHFQIQKSEQDGRTLSTIARLTPKQRELEVARMLGGAEITEESLAHARRLIEQAKQGESTPDIEASVQQVREVDNHAKKKAPKTDSKKTTSGKAKKAVKPNGKAVNGHAHGVPTPAATKEQHSQPGDARNKTKASKKSSPPKKSQSPSKAARASQKTKDDDAPEKDAKANKSPKASKSPKTPSSKASKKTASTNKKRKGKSSGA